MKPGNLRSLLFFLLLFAVAALALDASYAQGRGSGGQQKQQIPQGQQSQGQMMQQDMHQKSHMSQQQMHMPDEGMYGHEMMTAEERERYRQQLDGAENDREWSRMRAEHQREMQARAKAQGRQLDPPIFGDHMMTMEEKKRYTERMQAATSDAEKARIREEHQQQMMQRAEDLGIGKMLQDQ